MAWDFFISGIDYRRYTENLKGELLRRGIPFPSDTDIRPDNFSIYTVVRFEDLMFDHSISVEDQRQLLEVEELVAFRSKQNCFGMAQLVNYYNNRFSLNDIQNPLYLIVECSTVLKKEETTNLLDWLLSVSCLLSNSRGPEAIDKIYKWEAQRLVESGFCNAEEFSYFGDMVELFSQWKKIINKSSFDFYYWEHSY